mgnify:CR=1 FL=1
MWRPTEVEQANIIEAHTAASIELEHSFSITLPNFGKLLNMRLQLTTLLLTEIEKHYTIFNIEPVVSASQI